MIFVGFGGSCSFDNPSQSKDIEHAIRIMDCTSILDRLIADDVFPDGTIQRWQPYYTRKECHFLLEKGIVFDGDRLSTLYVESGSESGEDDGEDISASDDSEDDGESESGSD